MARKKKPELPKNYSRSDIDAALTIVHREYMMNVLALLSYDPTEKELNYIKVPVTTPDGGSYLVSILHIEGPKLNLQDLAKVADDSLKTDS